MYTKVFICPKCNRKIHDVRQLPIFCACGFINSTMHNIEIIEDISNKDVIEHNRHILRSQGYGIPNTLPPQQPLEKPDDLPEEILKWLEST